MARRSRWLISATLITAACLIAGAAIVKRAAPGGARIPQDELLRHPPSDYWAEWSRQPPLDVGGFLSERGRAIVEGALEVHVYRLYHYHQGQPTDSIFDYDEMRIVAEARLGDGAASRVRATLLDPATYGNVFKLGGRKKCGGFQPREAVRFTLGGEMVTFLICFTCADIGVIVQDGGGRVVHAQMLTLSPGKLFKVVEREFPARPASLQQPG